MYGHSGGDLPGWHLYLPFAFAKPVVDAGYAEENAEVCLKQGRWFQGTSRIWLSQEYRGLAPRALGAQGCD